MCDDYQQADKVPFQDSLLFDAPSGVDVKEVTTDYTLPVGHRDYRRFRRYDKRHTLKTIGCILPKQCCRPFRQIEFGVALSDKSSFCPVVHSSGGKGSEN